jgi:hypothetical protein
VSKLTRDVSLFASKIDRRTVQLILLLVSLTLFVIGAGAPMGEGGMGG